MGKNSLEHCVAKSKTVKHDSRITLGRVADILSDTPENIQDAVLGQEGFPQPDAAGLFSEREVRSLLDPMLDLQIPKAPQLPSATPPVDQLALKLPHVAAVNALGCRPANTLHIYLTVAQQQDVSRFVGGAIAAGLTFNDRGKVKPVRNVYGLLGWLMDQMGAAP
jgi:hypothetical protein